MKRLVLILAIMVVLCMGALLLIQPTPGPRTTLKLSGQEGLSFKATIKADGSEMTLSGKLPAELQVMGRSIDCSFQKMQPEGSISLALATEDGHSGSAATSSPQGGVRARISKKLFMSKFLITTFDP